MRPIAFSPNRVPLLAVVLCLAPGTTGCEAWTAAVEDTTDARLEEREMSRPLPERVVLPEPNGEDGLLPDDLLAQVLADAADRSGLAQNELKVARSRRVTWSDGSLGCPEPGMNYTQALVPGWHVLVEAGEATLDYRLGAQGFFRHCAGLRPSLRHTNEKGPSEEGPPRY